VKTPRASLARVCTLSLVALCLTTQLSGFAHLALVPHVACAEHGELVEADSRRAPLTPSGVEGAALNPGPGPRASDGAAVSSEPRVEAASSHSHDHCICTAVRRSPARVSRASTAAELRTAAPPTLLALRDVPTVPVLAPLDVAPKSSPPSV
jgi:hypothetical protein